MEEFASICRFLPLFAHCLIDEANYWNTNCDIGNFSDALAGSIETNAW
jgi:hypothetical protein